MNSNNSSRNFFPMLLGGAIFLLIMALFAVSYITAHNTAVALEEGIVATHKNNQNILSQYGQKIAEAAQVPEMARQDTQVLIREAIQGRYGSGGSGAIFQAIQEQNPSIDPVLYRKLQQLVESGRSEFQQGQSRLLDQTRVYKTALSTFWTGRFMGMAGYPKIELRDYGIITTERADEAFKTGREAPIELRPKAP